MTDTIDAPALWTTSLSKAYDWGRLLNGLQPEQDAARQVHRRIDGRAIFDAGLVAQFKAFLARIERPIRKAASMSKDSAETSFFRSEPAYGFRLVHARRRRNVLGRSDRDRLVSNLPPVCIRYCDREKKDASPGTVHPFSRSVRDMARHVLPSACTRCSQKPLTRRSDSSGFRG
jgi:hypothetical protein